MVVNSNLLNIYKQYREKKLAHAYLIETNNPSKLLEDIKTLIKAINCPEEYQEKCLNCNLCNLINKNNLPSLITIEPDGTSIKKGQIEDLKISFETKPIYSKYNTYIIMNAEKLNGSSANAMLKFVEEPTEGILGFFITNNKDVIIPTIKSRCQVLVATYESNNILDKLNITAEELNNYQTIIKDYLNKIKDKSLINNKELILSKISERKEIETLFKIIFEIFYHNFLRNIKKDYEQSLTYVYKEENNNKIIKQLNIITKFLQDLSYNVNIELLLDKFVIEMRNIHG